MSFCSMFFGMCFVSMYKTFGLSNGIDDLTLSIAGSIGAAGSAVSKLVCGVLLDKLGFKIVYGGALAT